MLLLPDGRHEALDRGGLRRVRRARRRSGFESGAWRDCDAASPTCDGAGPRGLPPNDLASSPLADELLALGAFRADVSGAGPAVYGLFHDRGRGKAAAAAPERRHDLAAVPVGTVEGRVERPLGQDPQRLSSIAAAAPDDAYARHTPDRALVAPVEAILVPRATTRVVIVVAIALIVWLLYVWRGRDLGSEMGRAGLVDRRRLSARRRASFLRWCSSDRARVRLAASVAFVALISSFRTALA